jgi:hypothetical protein
MLLFGQFMDVPVNSPDGAALVHPSLCLPPPPLSPEAKRIKSCMKIGTQGPVREHSGNIQGKPRSCLSKMALD